MIPVAAYSFNDVQASLAGPGGTISLGSGAGAAEEGISLEALEDQDILHMGADGSGMHVLVASKAMRVTVRLLKTSPVNGQLMSMFTFQRSSSANWGQNTLNITDAVRGDLYTCQQVAFMRQPANEYAKDARLLEWEFLAVQANPTLAQ